MKAQFVRTPEFDEAINQIIYMIKYLSKPRNLIYALLNIGFWFTFYILIIAIADTYKIIGG